MGIKDTDWQHVSKSTFRLKIQGGWLVGIQIKNHDHVDSSCVRFFSDPSHTWEL